MARDLNNNRAANRIVERHQIATAAGGKSLTAALVQQFMLWSVALMDIAALVMLVYVASIAREVRRDVEKWGAGNLRQGLKLEELIRRVQEAS